MKSYGVIYKITNLINGASYIGQSRNCKNRFIFYKSASRNKRKSHLSKSYICNALYKYGLLFFSFEILCNCDNEEELNLQENYYIKLYKTKVEFGSYNLRDGGDCGGKLSNKTKQKLSKINSGGINNMAVLNWFLILEIRQNEENLTMKQLSKKYNVSFSTINHISNNKSWRIENYPDSILELVKDIKINKINGERVDFNHSEETKKICSFKLAGENCNNNKLSWLDILDIRENKDKLSVNEIANKYNVTGRNIYDILNDKLWCMKNYPDYIKQLLIDSGKDLSFTSIVKKESNLDWKDVIDIRINIDNLTIKELSLKYSLKELCIYNVLTNRTYKMEMCPKEIIGKLPKDFKINFIKVNQKGENSNISKFTWEDVIEIRLNPQELSKKKLAKKYNVDLSTIYNILYNKTYKIEDYPSHIKEKLDQINEDNQQSNNLELNQIIE
jgi:group I intron endonuclease